MSHEVNVEQPLVINVNHLNYKVGNRYLLHDINWQVRQGDHWVVFGMNGCGKTTLLSAIAGYCNYTDGSLEVLGERYNHDNIFSLRKKIGWVSSSFFDKYYHHESVLNVVLSGLTGTLGVTGIEDKDVHQAKQLLRMLGVERFANQSFDKLSKGERQNVLIARALLADPEILLLDEPGTGLDIYARSHMLRIVQQLAQERNITMIYVTHYTEEILPMFSKCLLMKQGKVFRIGDTETLFQDGVLSEFLGYPVELQCHHGQRYVAVTDEAFALAVPDEVGGV